MLWTPLLCHTHITKLWHECVHGFLSLGQAETMPQIQQIIEILVKSACFEEFKGTKQSCWVDKVTCWEYGQWGTHTTGGKNSTRKGKKHSLSCTMQKFLTISTRQWVLLMIKIPSVNISNDLRKLLHFQLNSCWTRSFTCDVDYFSPPPSPCYLLLLHPILFSDHLKHLSPNLSISLYLSISLIPVPFENLRRMATTKVSIAGKFQLIDFH